MKKFIAQIMILLFLVATLSGCGDPKVINGKNIPTYGMFNEKNNKFDGVEYRVIVGNVVWAIILCETLIAPVYFIGFSLYEPVGVDTGQPKTIK